MHLAAAKVAQQVWEEVLDQQIAVAAVAAAFGQTLKAAMAARV
jgi:hypothetical protein